MVDNPAISDANLVVMIHIHRVIRNSITKSPLHARQQKTVLTRLISLTGFFTARLQQKCKCFVFVAASWWRSGFDKIQMTNSQRVLWPWRTRQLIKSKSSICNRDVKKSQKKMICKTIKKRPLIMNFKPHLHTLVRERYKIKMHGPTILFLIFRFLTLLMPVGNLM